MGGSAPKSSGHDSEKAPSKSAIREQLAKLLANDAFTTNAKRRKFLQYIVEESLAGRAERIKGYAIALAALDRDETFDPQTDPVVRLEARHLRRELEHYYLTVGSEDPVKVTIPKGGYVPNFERQSNARTEHADPASAISNQVQHRNLQLSQLPRWTIAAGLLLVAAVTAGIALTQYGGEPQSSTERLGARPPSIAVLPFENLTGDPEQQFFAAGTTAEIINALTLFDHFVVVSRAATSSHSALTTDIRHISNSYQSEYVLLGSIRRSSDRIRITTELYDGPSARALWVKSYENEPIFEDIITTQESIAGDVARSIASSKGIVYSVGLNKLNEPILTDFDGYECTLRLFFYWNGQSPQAHKVLGDCLEDVIVRTPEYAPAWAALAYVYLDQVRNGFNVQHEPAEALDFALHAAERAVQLAPASSMSHEALATAHYVRGELKEFRIAAEKAIDANPFNADMVANLGFWLMISGNPDEGRPILEEAIEISPVHPGWWNFAFAVDSYRNHDYEASLAALRNIDMDFYYLTHVMRAINFGQLGLTKEAMAAVTSGLSLT